MLHNLIICVVSSIICNASEIPSDLTTTKNGIVKGEKRAEYYAFEGIPYAEPPIGENRFEPPKPVKNWNEMLNATQPSPPCMQWNHAIFAEDRLKGLEDCLYLNIYRSLESPRNNEKYPVIVYIHSGAFMFGSGFAYGPGIMMKRPIIFISINYRLGPLGFLSTEDEQIPGNMGMKDQVMALRWVKENIESFGGDSNKVTITGYSAGSASVHLHYLSPLSDGLFQNGISHSGSALNPWVITSKPLQKALRIAENIGCPTTNTNLIVKCLKEKSAEDIVRSVKLFQPFLYNPFTPFGPVVETIKSKTPFLSQSPVLLMQQGKMKSKPWLASAVKDEGIYPAFELYRNETNFDVLNDNWSEFGAAILHLTDTVNIQNRNEVMNQIRQHYLNDKKISTDTFPELVKMITDYLYIVGIQRSIKLQSKYGSAPVYFYHYQYRAQNGLGQYLSEREDVKFGVSHGDDVYLILVVPSRSKHPYTDDELIMQSKLLDLYYDFAENGHLSFGDLEFKPAKQENEDTFNYLKVIAPQNITFEVTDDIAEEQFWKTFSFY